MLDDGRTAAGAAGGRSRVRNGPALRLSPDEQGVLVARQHSIAKWNELQSAVRAVISSTCCARKELPNLPSLPYLVLSTLELCFPSSRKQKQRCARGGDACPLHGGYLHIFQ